MRRPACRPNGATCSSRIPKRWRTPCPVSSDSWVTNGRTALPRRPRRHPRSRPRAPKHRLPPCARSPRQRRPRGARRDRCRLRHRRPGPRPSPNGWPRTARPPRSRPGTSTRRSSAAWPRRWRSSRPTGCMGISPPVSTRSDRSPWATRLSTSHGSCRRSRPSSRPGSRLRCSASTSEATPCSRRYRSSAPSIRVRSPTRSSTSPTTPSASGSARRSNRGAFDSRSTPTSDNRSFAA